MSFLSRDAFNFDLANHLNTEISSVLQTLCSTFNTCVCDESQKISSDGPFSNIIQNLLKGQISAEGALTELNEWILQQPFQLEEEELLPAVFIQQEREMMYPIRLYKSACSDEHGQEFQGVGAKAVEETPIGAIMAKYGGGEISDSLSEHLRLVKRSHHIKTAGPTRSVIINGDRENNGVFDLPYYIQNVEVTCLVHSFLWCLVHSFLWPTVWTYWSHA